MVSRMNRRTLVNRRLSCFVGACFAGLLLMPQAHAAKQRLCIYDPAGLEGEAYRAGMDYRLEMAQYGADLDLKVYTNERVAVEDFRTDQCDAVMATGIRTRQFNDIAGSLDVLGAATIVRQNKVDVEASFEVVRRYIETMSSAKAAGLMVSGQYEVAGIFPLGAAYAFVRDRGITSLEAASGKRIAALDYDKSQAEVIRRIGATAVAADTMNFANMFNNGTVDVIIAPTMAYKPLELYRGLAGKGGVSRYPLAFLTYQLLIKTASFPKGFGQLSRDYMVQNYDIVIASLRLADRGIPSDKWIDVPADSVQRNTVLLKKIRIDLAEQGIYNKQGLKLIKKIRCAVASELAECADNSENW
jgi:Family of unknown function (DUF6091)